MAESSVRKYVEMEKEDKLEVPVEFDEGISKLLAQINLKGRQRLKNTRNCF